MNNPAVTCEFAVSAGQTGCCGFPGGQGSQVQILSSRRSDGRCPRIEGSAYQRLELRRYCAGPILVTGFVDLYGGTRVLIARAAVDHVLGDDEEIPF